jgi:hypothetical protein
MRRLERKGFGVEVRVGRTKAGLKLKRAKKLGNKHRNLANYCTLVNACFR